MPHRQTNYQVLNSPNLQYICHRPRRDVRHTTASFISSSLSLFISMPISCSFPLNFFLSLHLCIPFSFSSPCICSSVSLPLLAVLSGSQLGNWPWDTSWKHTTICWIFLWKACVRVCACVKRKQGEGSDFL